MTDKWRPSISLVVSGILLTVMTLPLVALFFFYEGPSVSQGVSRGAQFAAAAVVIVTLLIAFVFVRAITRPMQELIERTARITAGDRDAVRPLTQHGTREMAELSGAFLGMARRLQARSDTIRAFATHVSHELKSPLTSIQGAAELLRDSGDEMDLKTRTRFENNIVADAQRMSTLVRRLIELARAESIDMTQERASLREILDNLVTADGLQIEIENGGDVRFRMSAENGAAVLSNLIDNSARHAATKVVLAAAATSNGVTITVADDGAGISENNRSRIFEPFFTTRRESGGTGLGLGIAAALLKAHDGTIRLVDSDRGARFEIGLPSA